MKSKFMSLTEPRKLIASMFVAILVFSALVFAAAPAFAATATTSTLSGTSSLGDLIILDSLFGGRGILGDGLGRGRDVEDLIILNSLFGGTSLFGTTGTLGGTNTGLGNLIILDELFRDGGRRDLGDLIILDSLFGGTSLFGGGLFRN